MSGPKPFSIVSSSEVYDVTSAVEVYAAEWSNPLGYRLESLSQVYGVILSKEDIATVAVPGFLLLESGDFLLLESGDKIYMEAA